MTRNNI